MHHRIRTLSKVLAAAALAASLSPAQAADIVTGATNLGTLTAPVTLTYGHAFNDTNPSLAGLQLAGVPGTVLASDNFYDDYAFTVGGSFANAIAATLDLGSFFNINNLQLRLYQGTLLTTTTGTINPADLVLRWTAPVSATGTGSGEMQIINTLPLNPGSYVLEVRGNIVGAQGGSYAGVMNFAPVPEPGAVGLMLAGLGMLGFMARRRKD
jgi:PEP-CTERM motif